jgi:hypothetical protein
LHPTVPPDARMYYAGVPDILRGIHLYNENFDTAVRIIYKNPNLRVMRVDKFPIVTEALDRTIFLEYRRRQLVERDDLVHMLATIGQCSNKSTLTWDFSAQNPGWEIWNQLSVLPRQVGAFAMQSEGTDPNLGSPRVDIVALALGGVEIEMRVRASEPTTQGAIYWTVDDQTDFSPAQQAAFTVQADNAWHTYRVNLAQDGKLAFGDRITRLRFDPVELPAEIELKTIKMDIACLTTGGEICRCP